MRKRFLSMTLAGILIVCSMNISAPEPAFGEIKETGNQTATASDALYQEEEDEEEESVLEDDVNTASGSDAEEELINDTVIEPNTQEDKPKAAFYSVAEMDAEDMFSFSGGTIQGLSTAYLDQLEEDEDGYISIDLVIPEEIHGVTVKEIGSQAFNGSKFAAYDNLCIRSIDLSQAAGLTRINDFAFDAYTAPALLYGSMDECVLELPDSLEEIGGNAFRNQKNLTGDLILSTNIKSIGKSAFENCGFDGNLQLPDNEVYTAVEGQAFYNCAFTGELVIPDHIKEIKGNYAFSGNHFNKVVLNNNMDSIGNSAFKNCPLLETVTVDGKDSIEGGITLPDHLAILGNRIVEDCPKLGGSMVIPDTVNSIGTTMFSGTKVETVYGCNNPSAKYEGNFLSGSSVTAFILPSEEIYNAVSAQISSSKKALCTYPVTITFLNDGGESPMPIDALYKRPINFKKNDSTLVWEADDSFALPECGENKIGFDAGWSFTQGGTVINEESLVSGVNLYPSISLSTPTVELKDVNKTYDGKTSYLEVQAFQPITEVDDSYYFYYFLGSEGSFSKLVHSGTKPIHYGLTDVADGGVYPIQIQFLHKENGASVRKWLYSGVAFFPSIKKADVSLLYPVTLNSVECPVSLSQIPISLPEDFPSGQIEWENPDQQLVLGSNRCGWIFTPDKAENFTQASYHGSTEITGVKKPVVTKVSINPENAETEPGRSIQFTAQAEGVAPELQSVKWSVKGAFGSTLIDDNGLLKIGADETAEHVTVMAVSTYDPSKTAEAEVSIRHKAITYTVTFDTCGGNALEPVTSLTEGENVKLPVPEREGYQFDGWYSAPVGGTKLENPLIITGDLMVYAHWILVKPSGGENGSENGDSDDSGNDDSGEAISAGDSRPSSISVGVVDQIVSGKVNAPAGTDGTVKAVIAPQDVDQIIRSAAGSQELKKDVISISVTTDAKNINKTAVVLPGGLDYKMQENSVNSLNLTFENHGVELNIPQNRIQEMGRNASLGIRISAERADLLTEPGQSQDVLKERPSYNIEAVYESTGRPVLLSDGIVAEVAVPYELKLGETPDRIYAVQVNPDGSVRYIESSRYDAVSKKLFFSIDTFGTYSIAVKP